ncbi:MarR family transcriptional regulator [Rhodococcus triatomae]|uniref:MarR family protein n=1 Tax=Rhodococcus triatomae TaxID=300028 RepID=A0A1G8JJ60_9NOCA|nr:MarR family transcriptional regulator [Rhodococcus triatomae]QNG19707.1 MarR family transcriptional regulator [Rhodococcus triatomae]QNG24378.1 MarR family transcriptional regulator [Rhodococcus triatomae]SDI31103.1 MarR family protein [Rhodococcus triatomae]
MPDPSGAGDTSGDVRQFIEQLAMVLVSMGFPPMPARAWAAMMSSDADTTTPGELSERLGVSPAAVSGAVNYLLQVGLIERVAVPGSRRRHYRVSVELWANAFERRQRALGRFSALAGEGIAMLGADSPSGRRIAEVRDFFDYVSERMPRLLAQWREERRAEA